MPPWLRRTARVLRLSVKTVVIVAIVAVLAPVLAGGVAFATLVLLPLPGNLPPERTVVQFMQPTQVVDAGGNLIATFRSFESVLPVRQEDIPPVLVDALVAAEDRNFWSHNGVDFTALARAAWANYQEEDIVQGGSTITQQYVKNVYTEGDRTVSRKVREAILAARLERELTKDEILFRYLDTVYFGEGAYGVGAAAQTYFRKPVADLTLSEAALLVGLVPAPTAYSPRDAPEVAESQRRRVLTAMLETGAISQEAHDAAAAEAVWLGMFGPPPGPATVVHPAEQGGALAFPFFVDYVRRYLLERYGPDVVYRGGLRVETTVEPALQALAEEEVARALGSWDPPLEMSLVSIEPRSGAVRALVGGRDWSASQVNLALGGSTGFQPGSAFKPIVLAEAFEQGLGPETVYPGPGTWPIPGCDGSGCTVSNYDGSGYGNITLRRAMWSSVNTVYTQLVHDVGTAATAEMAHRLGIESLRPDGSYGISLALGAYEVAPLEMAASYAVLANHGIRAPVTPVVRVLDSQGNVLEDNTGLRGEQVLDPAIADTVTDVLTGVVTSGTGRGAAIGRPVAGKTGTAEEYRAAWFVGYTPQLATAVWMGHSDAQRTLRLPGYGIVSGGGIPATTFGRFMRAALQDQPVIEFPVPGPLPRVTPQGEESGLGGGIEPGGRRNAAVTPSDCGGPCQERPSLRVPAPAPPTTTTSAPVSTTTTTAVPAG